MNALKAIVNLAGQGLAACLLLLPWPAAAELGGRETKLTAADGARGDNFGAAVAISGDTAVIGAYGDDDLGEEFGSAYVFERDPLDPAAWTETAKLTAADGAATDFFGFSVAISGDSAVIGAYLDDDLGLNSGSAYLFERDPIDPAAWIQTAKLTSGDGAEGDLFGNSVAISGDTAVVGSFHDDDLGTESGSAYVFERDPLDPAVWTETAKLIAADGAAGDRFGTSVAISGDTAVIGARGNDGPLDSGAVYVFQRNPLDPADWTQIARLTAADGGQSDYFGNSAAISGDTALIGAYRDDDLGFDAGAAYVFERQPFDPADWNQAAKLTAADGAPFDLFGGSVAISGNTALIGTLGDDDAGFFSGSAYVFERDPLDPAVWNQTAKLTASDGAENDQCGECVAISGDTAVIGASFGKGLFSSSGSAYAYTLADCELALTLEPSRLLAGEELRVAVDLHHRRPVTVTVPLRLSVEDAAGRVLAQKRSPPVTLEPGDHVKLRLAVSLPPTMPAGTYQVRVAVKGMKGIAWTSRQLRIVE